MRSARVDVTSHRPARRRRITRRTAVATAGLLAATAALAMPAGANPTPRPAPGAPRFLHEITASIGAQDLWHCGWTGAGVDVALIDTGVAPVPGSGAVVNGPDLSFDAQLGVAAGVDAMGHGTHLASIINARDPGFAPDRSRCRIGSNGKASPHMPPLSPTLNDPNRIFGVAPGARVVNVKAGAADGSVDVSQVIAGIDWVVANARTEGRNIRVLSLAFGTDSAQHWQSDPLSHAVERAWRAGIVVVVSAGNDGTTIPELGMPARNPNVIAVGASDLPAAPGRRVSVADFASRGTAARQPDLVLPGVSVVGLRVPGGVADTAFPEARIGDRFVRASGTSQSAAAAAGLMALLVQRFPAASPDQLKAMLRSAGVKVNGPAHNQGAGTVDPRKLLEAVPGQVTAPAATTTGTGSLHASRGSFTLDLGTGPLTGERDVWGRPWSATGWARTAPATLWANGAWMGQPLVTATGPAVWQGTFAGPLTGTPWAAETWPTSVWENMRWRNGAWENMRWRTGSWDNMRWRTGGWDNMRWRSGGWENMRWR